MAQKIRIMKNRQQPSDEEIQSYMDFDRLLENRKVAKEKASLGHIIKWGIPLLLTAAMTVWFFLSKDQTYEVTESKHINAQPSRKNITPVQPLDSIPEVKPPDRKLSAEKMPQKSASAEQPDDKKGKQTATETQPATTNEVGYTQAAPLNGYPDLYNYFSTNLIYPAEALKDSIEGIQTISFVITAEGKVGQIESVNSLGEPFEKECRRLIENMPVWKPATLDGKPVTSKMSLPLTFQIQKIKK